MKLIIFNGPSGVGKSTIAAMLTKEFPSSVIVDIDELRRSVPNYKENREESLRVANEKAGEEIEKSLASGHDVIVDKAILDPSVIDSFIQIGNKCGADVYEFLLFAGKSTIQQRADDRGYRPGSLLTRQRVGEMWERVDELRRERMNAIVINTSDLTSEEVLAEIKAKLS